MTALKPMTRQELADYYPFLTETFPPNELKPLKRFYELWDRGIYDAWLLMDGETPRGLALMLRAADCRFVLLDYLAMLEKGGGWGSQCLELLKAQYPQGILVEAEAILPDLPPEIQAIRQRRQRFYQRAGFVPCPFDNEIFGVVYLVHLWARALPDDRNRLCARELFLNYQEQLPQKWLDAHVFVEGFRQKEEEKQ